MNKVITINLAGRSYSVEEAGYNALKSYLDDATQKLGSNPDKEEILKDFNIAIAEKCDAYLGSSKNVILASEIEKIIEQMGPVDVAGSAAGTAADGTGADENFSKEKRSGANPGPDSKSNDTDGSSSRPHKKLYLLPDTGVIFGVCSGIAAYFEMDVTLVRVIFIALAVITHGAWIFVYFVMGMVVPKANTPEEKAEAWGAMRTTAQDLMQRARSGYEHFKNNDDLRKWKKQLREERRHWQQRARWHAKTSYVYQGQNRSAFSELVHSIMGMIWLAFLIYIAWFGYEHVEAVRNLFDVIGNALGRGLEQITEWIKMRTRQ